MRYVLRWWETLGKAERIVAMSLATGGLVAMVNSTAWAIAVSYMARQKALVAMAGYRSGETTSELAASDADEVNGPAEVSASAAASTADGAVVHAAI